MTQAQTILRHIKSLGSISPQEAYRDYQITRLAARILDLKRAGYHIETDMREHPLTGTRYARYTLVLETGFEKDTSGSVKTDTSGFVLR